MDKNILRDRFAEVLEAYDFTEEQVEEIVDQLVPVVTKLDMYDTFEDDDTEESEGYDDLDTIGRDSDSSA